MSDWQDPGNLSTYLRTFIASIYSYCPWSSDKLLQNCDDANFKGKIHIPKIQALKSVSDLRLNHGNDRLIARLEN